MGQLAQVSNYVVADAYFPRAPFVSRVQTAGFKLITRLRHDVRLRYYYQGAYSDKGRPKTYRGKVDPRNLHMDVFQICGQADDGIWISYEAVVQVQALKRAAKVVIQHLLDPEAEEIIGHRIYARTDTELPGQKLVQTYRCRYQQEFLFRDVKQYSGLEHCQARSWQKIDFYFGI